MRSSHRPLVIASRRSRLAQAQAQMVGLQLARITPTVKIQYLWIESDGDKHSQGSLADAGGKGLFAAAVEQAVLRHEADLAVHSLKDLPASGGPAGLVIAAVPQRADARDCLISGVAARVDQLPRGATLGTASPRRASQARRLRPDLKIQLIRGNIQTRLRKVLDEGQHDATLLAVAGLQRASMATHSQNPIDVDAILPAAGQGALAIQCRGDDHVTLARCLPLNHARTAACVHAERQIVAGLNGGCHSPIAVLAQPTTDGSDAGFRLRARVLSQDGQTCLGIDRHGPIQQLAKTAKQVVTELQEAGCDQLLKHPT